MLDDALMVTPETLIIFIFIVTAGFFLLRIKGE